MIALALKVPLIKMEDGSPFDIWNWKLSTRPRPQLNCQNILFWERRPQLLRAERRRAKNSILICQFWFRRTLSKLAQLFTFYWDLTRNKFSFPLSLFEIRSTLLIGVYPDAILESLEKLIGDHWEHRSRLKELSEKYGRIADSRAWIHPPYHLRSSGW